jgi:hypothetical protein
VRADFRYFDYSDETRRLSAMKTIMGVFCLMLVLTFGGFVRPAQAQVAGAQDLYDASRARYLADLTSVATAHIDQRRSTYLGQVRNNPAFWWGVWEQHQPYSQDVHFTVPDGYKDIPVEPGVASSSPYARNVTQLVFGHQDEGTGRTAASALPAGPADRDDGSENGFDPFDAGNMDINDLTDDGGQEPVLMGQ